MVLRSLLCCNILAGVASLCGVCLLLMGPTVPYLVMFSILFLQIASAKRKEKEQLKKEDNKTKRARVDVKKDTVSSPMLRLVKLGIGMLRVLALSTCPPPFERYHARATSYIVLRP